MFRSVKFSLKYHKALEIDHHLSSCPHIWLGQILIDILRLQVIKKDLHTVPAIKFDSLCWVYLYPLNIPEKPKEQIIIHLEHKQLSRTAEETFLLNP